MASSFGLFRALQQAPSTLALRQTAGTSGMQVRGMATKKAGGSSQNGRDSAGRRLGIKLQSGMMAKAGSIIVRQRGCKFRPGENVGIGKDHTIFAKQPGIVKYTRHPHHKKKRHIISIEMLQMEEATTAMATK